MHGIMEFKAMQNINPIIKKDLQLFSRIICIFVHKQVSTVKCITLLCQSEEFSQ